MAQTANGAVLAAGAEAEHTESLGNDDALLLVVRGRNTLKHLESLHRGGTTGGLVGNHATHGSVEDAGGSAEVEGTSTSRVETGHLAKEGLILDYTESALRFDFVPPFHPDFHHSHDSSFLYSTKDKIKTLRSSQTK